MSGEMFFAVLGVMIGAFVVWLAVRVVNRRERWAKRLAIGIALLVLYPLSFGPAVWLTAQDCLVESAVARLYWPFLWAYVRMPHSAFLAIHWYGRVGIPKNKGALLAHPRPGDGKITYWTFNG
jgi:hypothetical protein